MSVDSKPDGVIEPGKLYVVSEARERLRLGLPAWRQLCRDGLPVVRVGRQAYVFGDELLKAFQREAAK
jgi:hypothetical protein